MSPSERSGGAAELRAFFVLQNGKRFWGSCLFWGADFGRCFSFVLLIDVFFSLKKTGELFIVFFLLPVVYFYFRDTSELD